MQADEPKTPKTDETPVAEEAKPKYPQFVFPMDGFPEVISINGMRYARAGDRLDATVNEIEEIKELGKRTGLSLKQAMWYIHRGAFDTHLPDR